MKKVALTTFILLSIFGVGAFSLLQSDKQQEITSSHSQSQQDIAADVSSPKDFFEYSLSRLGEEDLDTIKAEVNDDTLVKQTLNIDAKLFQTYLSYKQALSALEPFDHNQLTIEQLTMLNEAILNLQLQYFSEVQIAQLFDEENRLRQLALEKLTIKTQASDIESQTHLLNQALSEQPDYIRESERNNALAEQLEQASQLDSQDKYIARVALVGDAGAQRLQKLDEQRASFETQLATYLKQRQDILNRDFLGQDEKQAEIIALRKQSFDATQWRRIEALERIHDSQN
ncbi:lipase secretion chaperone [Vibrio diabolicus]|uniref:lipase secretion chaperone n=1 Tax=Vibrio TaxID=662 RepID=UPI0020A5537C|nr:MULTISPECIES: lipase secretion chaperone [Vibrio]MCG9229021.1 lipase secretion chaperone [Vibrio diabolicus]MCG9571452.1 lipase secretion chaperone [Vibrio diabolicus]MCG9592975.1 lipase secretion chaperone [Vibrio diabolicus]MCG9772533.1 lipase secretion chaperone [Vibrio diabolicus]